MKFLFALFATLFFALPAWAVDVQMGANGNLVFEPAEVSIAAGESVHFVNNMLPPHNVVVEDHPELSHEGLAFAPGESFDIAFSEPGDYTYWCAPHKGAGMIRNMPAWVHVS
jgi:plastocyanin